MHPWPSPAYSHRSTARRAQLSGEQEDVQKLHQGEGAAAPCPAGPPLPAPAACCLRARPATFPTAASAPARVTRLAPCCGVADSWCARPLRPVFAQPCHTGSQLAATSRATTYFSSISRATARRCGSCFSRLAQSRPMSSRLGRRSTAKLQCLVNWERWAPRFGADRMTLLLPRPFLAAAQFWPVWHGRFLANACLCKRSG